jgi:hypothetical protein
MGRSKCLKALYTRRCSVNTIDEPRMIEKYIGFPARRLLLSEYQPPTANPSLDRGLRS